jgi:hypothetical protein
MAEDWSFKRASRARTRVLREVMVEDSEDWAVLIWASSEERAAGRWSGGREGRALEEDVKVERAEVEAVSAVVVAERASRTGWSGAGTA